MAEQDWHPQGEKGYFADNAAVTLAVSSCVLCRRNGAVNVCAGVWVGVGGERRWGNMKGNVAGDGE